VEEKKYSAAEMERNLKIQEVIAKAMARKLTWWEAAEIMGVTDRTMRRWRGRIEEGGYTSLYDRRRHPSPSIRTSMSDIFTRSWSMNIKSNSATRGLKTLCN
jgi:transposase